MFFSQLIRLGTKNLNFSSATKVRLMNIVTLITVAISLSYSFNYLFILDHILVGVINLGFTLAYGATLFINKINAHKKAKIWFFCILMIHLVVCTNIYVTNASGFHLYYFLVPTGAYLLFELNEKIEKLLLSFIAVVLFFYCENTLNQSPLIVLSNEMNHILYQSVIFFNMIEVIIVLTIFSSTIEKNEATLIKQATTDSLTGIANRHLFFEKGKTLLADAHIQNSHLSVALLDFDHFKTINDNYGHPAGDICLKEITQLIKSNLRNTDLFARIGGEEFAIILPDTSLQEANNITEKIRLLIAEKEIKLDQQQPISCTVSIGICNKNQTIDKIKTLLVNADNALYQAKVQGRNRVALFSEKAIVCE